MTVVPLRAHRADYRHPTMDPTNIRTAGGLAAIAIALTAAVTAGWPSHTVLRVLAAWTALSLAFAAGWTARPLTEPA